MPIFRVSAGPPIFLHGFPLRSSITARDPLGVLLGTPTRPVDQRVEDLGAGLRPEQVALPLVDRTAQHQRHALPGARPPVLLLRGQQLGQRGLTARALAQRALEADRAHVDVGDQRDGRGRALREAARTQGEEHRSLGERHRLVVAGHGAVEGRREQGDLAAQASRRPSRRRRPPPSRCRARPWRPNRARRTARGRRPARPCASAAPAAPAGATGTSGSRAQARTACSEYKRVLMRC